MKAATLYKKIFAFTVLATVSSYMYGQNTDNSIKTEQIDIVKAYQPLLSDAHKIDFHAHTPQTDSLQYTYSYDIIDKVIQIPFTPGTLKPLPILHTAKKKAVESGFVQAATGTQYAQYILAHADYSFNPNDIGGIEFHRLGLIGSLANQNISLNDLSLYNTYSKNSFVNNTTLNGIYNIYHAYGYDHDVTKQSASQTQTGRGLVNLKDNWQGVFTKTNITYSGFAQAYTYFDSYNESEVSEVLNLHVDKGIKKRHHIVLDITADNTGYSSVNKDSAKNTFLLPILLGYEYRIPGFITHLGLNGTLQNSQFFVMPDIYSEKNIIKQYIITYAGWRDGIQKNDLVSLSETNPFMASNPRLLNSYVDNSYSGVRGALGQHFSYNAVFTWKSYLTNKSNNFSGMPLFVPSSGDSTRFAVKYDRLIDNNLRVELAYADLNTYKVTFTMEYHNYATDQQLYAWYLPAFITGIDGQYRFSKKLFAEATLSYLSGAHALTGHTTMGADNMPETVNVKLKDHFDANLKVNYTIDNSWDVFLNLSNLAYSPYYQYYNYPSYHAQILIGAMYKF